MASVPEIAAMATQQAADKLVKNFEIMPADKQQWKPLDLGRSAFDQILECLVINQVGAQTFRDRAFPNIQGDQWGQVFGKAAAENDTPEKLIASFKQATADLVAAAKAFPEDQLDNTIVLPFDGSTRCWSEVIFFAYWNMTYHEGQINYIQTLYGDKEYHA